MNFQQFLFLLVLLTQSYQLARNSNPYAAYSRTKYHYHVVSSSEFSDILASKDYTSYTKFRQKLNVYNVPRKPKDKKNAIGVLEWLSGSPRPLQNQNIIKWVTFEPEPLRLHNKILYYPSFAGSFRAFFNPPEGHEIKIVQILPTHPHLTVKIENMELPLTITKRTPIKFSASFLPSNSPKKIQKY